MNLSQKIGTVCILLSLAAFAHIYYPIIIQEILYRTQPDFRLSSLQPISTQFGLVINKLGINEAITADVDPFNPSDYLSVLHSGLAHARGSSLPGEPGTVYIFGHSSDNPFSVTRYNTSFYLLSKLQTGDRITIYYQTQKFDYSVSALRTVSPEEVSYLTHEEADQLILQTCTPVGTSLRRLLVFAQPLSSLN